MPPKLQNYFKERQYPQLIWKKNPLPHQRRIWFHAASGEVEYIKPLLKLWKLTYPDDLLFLTYFSTSALDLIPRIPEIDGWAPLPIDLPKPCQKFISALHPHILIISRTDLWPTLLKTLSHTPKILVASTWSEGSKKTQTLGRWMSQWCLPYLNKVCVVNEHDQQWIQKNISPIPQIVITGDPRFDQVQARLQQQRTLPATLTEWVNSATSSSTFVAGSTWPEDEAILFETISHITKTPGGVNTTLDSTNTPQALSGVNASTTTDLTNLMNTTKVANVNNVTHVTSITNLTHLKFPKIRWIIVPHENTTEHLQSIKEKLHRLQLPFLLWSENSQTQLSPSVPILIFDEKGWLAELYQLADLAFIGGSFKRQVHSVMEALGCGAPVLVGPYYKNNREAMEFSTLKHHDVSFVTVINNSNSDKKQDNDYSGQDSEDKNHSSDRDCNIIKSHHDHNDLACDSKRHNNKSPASSLFRALHFYFNLDSKQLSEIKEKIKINFNQRCGGTAKTFQEIQKFLMTIIL